MIRSFYLFIVAVIICSVAMADDWPQWRGPSRDGVWAEEGILQEFPDSQIKINWRAPVASGYSGPIVADGLVYVTDRVVEPKEIERVHCFDWKTGEQVWSHQYDCPYGGVGYKAGPRASVLVHDGLAYSLGATGHLLCFHAKTGRVAWKRDLQTEYKIRMPNWGIAASPVIEDDLLIVQVGGANDACIAAFDRKTGAERWTAASDDASYSAPIVVTQAGKRVVICWTGERVLGLDAASGKLFWEQAYKWEKWPIGIADPVADRGWLLVSEVHKGSILLKLSDEEQQVEKIWHRRKDELDDGKALHCLMSTPYIAGEHIYGADNEGVLRCLRLDSGEEVWQDDSAVPRNRWATIHMVRNGDRTWLFNERGELVIGKLSPEGYHEISRAKLLDPTTEQLRRRDGVTWSHPAYAYRHVFARTDKELVCADLSANQPSGNVPEKRE